MGQSSCLLPTLRKQCATALANKMSLDADELDGHIAFAGAAEQARMLGAGTSTALTELYLERIACLDAEFGAYSVVLAETARTEAAADLLSMCRRRLFHHVVGHRSLPVAEPGAHHVSLATRSAQARSAGSICTRSFVSYVCTSGCAVIVALSYRPIIRGVLKNERLRAATDTPCGCTRRFRRSFPRRVRSEATQASDEKTHAQEDQTRRRYPGRIHLRIGANVG
jgi:hypothetical protein